MTYKEAIHKIKVEYSTERINAKRYYMLRAKLLKGRYAAAANTVPIEPEHIFDGRLPTF